MLMVIRVQAAVKNVVRKMNNALTTIITNTAAYLPELIGEYAAARPFLFKGVIFRYSLVLLPLRLAGLLWCSVPDLGRLSLKFEQ